MEHYDEFEQYLRATEPGPKERAELWQTAIGLQKVDGLEVSDYLVFFLRNLLLGETNELKTATYTSVGNPRNPKMMFQKR